MALFAFRQQPFKAMYLTYFTVSLLFVRLPYWIAISLLPSWRPRRSWNFKRAVRAHLIRALAHLMFTVGYGFMTGSMEKIQVMPGFVWVEPLPQELVKGDTAEMAKVNNVKPARTFGFWFESEEKGNATRKAAPGEKVLYFLHGGGYIVGDASPGVTGLGTPIIKNLFEKCSQVVSRAFSLNYRLASGAPFEAANPWPAQLLDALAGYRYLIETAGFRPENIIVAGGSAGGHLAINLARYLCLHGKDEASLSPPGGVILLSPTADWACTHDDNPESSMIRNANTDAVGIILTSGYTARALRGALPEEHLYREWLSPASLKIRDPSGLFSGFPKTIMITGGAEQTLDPMHTLRDRIANDTVDGTMTYIEYPDALHEFLARRDGSQEPEGTQALLEIRAWMEKL